MPSKFPKLLTLASAAMLLTISACSHQTRIVDQADSAPAPESLATASLNRQVTLVPTQFFQQAQVDSYALLERLTWGGTGTSLAQLKQVGADAYLIQQLQARQAQLPAAIQAQIDAMTISQKNFVSMMHELDQQREASAKMKGTDDSLRKAYQQELTRIAREAATRSTLRAVYSSNQLFEQMDWFWMNHFNISNRKENLRAMLGDFEETAIRPYALGNFRDLLRATMLHPAMLRYLDNEHNAVNKINENYARELLELHTMGVGSGYTQMDVQELARVLTGLGINLRADNARPRARLQAGYGRLGLTEFNPARHDFGDKLILGTKVSGKGIAELDQILNLLTRQPATAKFISQKLAQYFVTDEPSEALVQGMATQFLKTDGDIPSVLQTMFESQEFVASLGKKFKDPMHYVLSSVRLAYADKAITNTGPILNWINTLGQQANGHQTPDGYSLKEMAWASPAQMTARFDVAKLIARGAPNLFKNDEQETNAEHRELAKTNLAQNDYVKSMSSRFSTSSQEALSQSSSAQEWNVFLLASPEMMRR
ncbi:DUF1800 domain-containing protein [Undibacterium flavidum]|uniref:DUF1800 domain-containing protein n=1 Tax=Undibacterium flavidum TaxID=2762297 RepID=A0ABR6YHG6_9BURK|nr:DUF1800 domain-containing protein [Undibacterium flavidum]MBC3876016.1 DUF1800 domain-containing protein [Undibacterium flavidum]